MTTPTIGATYETTRGPLTVLERRPLQEALLVQTPRGSRVLVSVSDWETWQPTLVVKDAF